MEQRLENESNLVPPIHMLVFIRRPTNLNQKIIPKRHRMIVQTFLIEHNDQDIQIGSKWLWNPEHDDHVTVQKAFSTFSVAVNAHFIYIE